MDDDYRALEETIYLLGEKVARAGQSASQRGLGSLILSELRSAHNDMEIAILAAMNVMHNHGAAPEGAAGLLGFQWHSWDPRDRERFEKLWGEIRTTNIGDPSLRRRLRELLVLRDF